MYFILYQITNNINGKIYVGVHKTKNINDGYMGSGTLIREAIKKYGVENFSKTIISFHASYEELLEAEKTIVDKNFIRRDDTYNLAIGGESCWNYVNLNGLSGHKFTSEEAKRASKLGVEKIELLKNTNSEWYNMYCNRITNNFRYSNGFEGRKHSRKTIKKMSEIKKNANHGVGEANSQYGTRWINNGFENKKIKNHLVDEYINNGWLEGRLVKVNPPKQTGKKWANNGKINKLVNSIPDGWIAGRIK
jgi:hypothetical protein